MYVFYFSISKESKLTYYFFSPKFFLFFETFYFSAPIQNFCYSSHELILIKLFNIDQIISKTIIWPRIAGR